VREARRKLVALELAPPPGAPAPASWARPPGAFVACTVLLLLAQLVGNREGVHVPSTNELNYLPLMFKYWHPDFLRNDWTFAGDFSGHLAFNVIFGAPTLLLPMEVVGWLGRLGVWLGTFVLLLRIGERFRVPLWGVTLAILLWLLYRQSAVGGEWILGSFEAKCIAYLFLLGGLLAALNGAYARAAGLAAGALTFHPLVGGWGALCVGGAILCLRPGWRVVARAATVGAACALPGVLLLAPLLVRNAATTPNDFRLLVLLNQPLLMDPSYFMKRDVILVLALAAFNAAQFWRHREDRASRFLFWFQLWLGAVFVAGFAMRAGDLWRGLYAMPFRLFPVFTPLFFLLNVMHALRCPRLMGRGLVALGLLGLMSFGNPVGVLADNVRGCYQWGGLERDDLHAAFTWISEHTPNGSIVIAPPWRAEVFYVSRRAQIASWHIPRYDEIGAWRRRIEAMVGPSLVRRSAESWRLTETLERRYEILTRRKVEAIRARYGGDYFVSRVAYDYPIVFEVGRYRVYRLRAP